jgi:predicted transcriptional regulator
MKEVKRMDKFEKLVKEIMAEAEEEGEPVTHEEAEEKARM